MLIFVFCLVVFVFLCIKHFSCVLLFIVGNSEQPFFWAGKGCFVLCMRVCISLLLFCKSRVVVLRLFVVRIILLVLSVTRVMQSRDSLNFVFIVLLLSVEDCFLLCFCNRIGWVFQ